MKRFLCIFLALSGAAFAQSPSKAVKTNASDVLVEPTANALWTANPLTPTFITKTPSSLLSNEQALSGFSTGVLSVTTGTGDLTSFSDSAGLRGALSDETGTGALVFATSPSLVTPSLGVATATSINGMIISSGTGTLDIADGKTLAVSNTLTLEGTDAATVDFAAGGTVGYASDTLAQFANTTSSELAGIITNETGSGALAFATSPTFVTPNIGVATATSVNGLTVSSTTGTLTMTNGKTLSVANTLSFSGTDSASVNFGAGGTVPYTSGTLAQFSNTTSLQLNGIISDNTGSGALVFATSPTLVSPTLGVATATSLNGLTISTTTGSLSITNGKTLSSTNTLTFSGTDGSTLNIGSGGVLGTAAYTAASAYKADFTTLAAADGGTGIASYAVGDLLIANGTTSLTKLPDIATGNALISGGIGAVPSWGKITYSHVTGIAASGANADIQSLAPPDGTIDVTGAVTSTVAGATTSLPGTVELATTTEAAAMTDTARAVTSEGVASALNATRTVNITADATTITVGTERVLYLTSDSTTATDRTFQLQGGVAGQELTIQWIDGTDKGEFAPFSSIDFSLRNGTSWVPSSGDTIKFVRTPTIWYEVARNNNGSQWRSTETIIGTWVDGSTLYRKTIDVGALPNTTTTTDAHGISGVTSTSFKRIYGIAQNGTIAIPLPGGNVGVTVVSADSTNINITTSANFSPYSGYVTLEYTK